MAETDLGASTPSDAVKEAFEALGGVQRSSTVVRWINDQYPNRWSDEKLRNYLRGCSVNHPVAISYHPHFPRFLYNRGVGEFELYSKERHGVFDDRGYPEGQISENVTAADEIREIAQEIEGGNEFAYEAHLRDYLARNLNLLEPGLALWTGNERGSVEYPIDGRRIDILAKDRDGVPVIVELKLSRGHERTLGQVLYYRGKLKHLLGLPRVRIIMVASEITEELRIASIEVSDVDLFSYTLTMQVQRLDLKSSKN